MSEPRMGCPDLGVGVGLRVPHYQRVLAESPAMDFFEIISENFMVPGGKPMFHLEQVLRRYPLIQHGVSLDIGGPEALNRDYLERLKALTRRVKPAWISDHLCWCGTKSAHLHDLLPLPYTQEAIERVAERAAMVQDFLELPFALENTSSYMAYRSSEMPEWDFVAEILERANIGLLLDVNNVYVAAYNHGFDPYDYLRALPFDRVLQIHVAGHSNLGKVIIDTHKGPIIDPVWELYGAAIQMAGPVSTVIEWDDQIPTWEVLSQEAELARVLRKAALQQRQSLVSVGKRPTLAGATMPLERSDRLSPSTALGASQSPGWTQGGPSEHAGRETISAGE